MGSLLTVVVVVVTTVAESAAALAATAAALVVLAYGVVGGGQVALAVDFAFANPDFDADDADFGEGLYEGVSMSARRVCRGVRPSLNISLRLISAPLRRPDT